MAWGLDKNKNPAPLGIGCFAVHGGWTKSLHHLGFGGLLETQFRSVGLGGQRSSQKHLLLLRRGGADAGTARAGGPAEGGAPGKGIACQAYMSLTQVRLPTKAAGLSVDFQKSWRVDLLVLKKECENDQEGNSLKKKTRHYFLLFFSSGRPSISFPCLAPSRSAVTRRSSSGSASSACAALPCARRHPRRSMWEVGGFRGDGCVCVCVCLKKCGGGGLRFSLLMPTNLFFRFFLPPKDRPI